MKLKKLLGDPDFDCPPEMSEVALTIRDLEFERDDLEKRVEELEKLSNDMESELHGVWADYHDARSLIDGCYEIVELWKAETPSQIEWKRKWLESARKHGASGL